jgi:hypothetical protein
MRSALRKTVAASGVNLAQLAIGIMCLAGGALEYLTGRLGNAYFLAPFERLSGVFRGFPSPFGAWGEFAPDFLHPLGFALVSRRWPPGAGAGACGSAPPG